MHSNEAKKATKKHSIEMIFYLYRFSIILLVISLFMPSLNPGRITSLINENMSLFTSGISYS